MSAADRKVVPFPAPRARPERSNVRDAGLSAETVAALAALFKPREGR